MTLSLPKNRSALMLIVPSLLTLAACESSGSYRVGSVGVAGAQGVQGEPGEAGPAGSAGATGPAGATGAMGAAGSGLSLGDAGALAVGGLVGPGGVAGTGLLASTGSPSNTNPVISGVLVKSGGLVNVLADKGLLVASTLDSKISGGTNLVGTVVGVVKSTGVALVQTGNGQQYLVDGLAAAPGQLITATIGNATAIGSSNASPLIGASILSPGQQTGSLLTVGVGSNGQLVTLQPSNNGGSLLGGLGSTSPTSGGVVAGATAAAGGVLNTATGGQPVTDSNPAAAPVKIVQSVTGLIKPVIDKSK